jgi:hypothetical protein
LLLLPSSHDVLTRTPVVRQFLELWWRGNDLMGTIQVLHTAAGDTIRNLLLAGERCVRCCARDAHAHAHARAPQRVCAHGCACCFTPAP